MDTISTPSSPGPVAALRRQVLRWQTSLVMVLGLAAAIVTLLVAVNERGSAKAVLLGVGTSLLVTVLYGWIQAAVTSSAQERMLGTAVAEAVEPQIQSAVSRASAATLEHAAAMNKFYLPIGEYHSTVDPADRLNRDLQTALAQSTSYAFVGLSGKFVPARFQALAASPQHRRITNIDILVADYRDPDAIRTRISFENQRPDSLDATLLDVQQTIVALFDLRAKVSSVTVHLIQPSLTRLEIFDQSIFVTLFGAASGAANRFPASVRYSNESPMYSSFEQEVQFLKAQSSKFLIHAGLAETALERIFGEVLGTPRDPSALAELRDRYAAYYRDFCRPVLEPENV